MEGAALPTWSFQRSGWGKKNLKNQEIAKEPKKEREKKIAKIKRLKKSQKKKGGLGFDLPSGFRVLRVMCVWFFAQASWETQVWLHTKAEIPTSAQAVRSLDFQKSRNHCATCSKSTRAGNTKLTAPLTPWELHWGWLRPTSCLKSIYLGQNPLSCFLGLKNTAASEGWTRSLSW